MRNVNNNNDNDDGGNGNGDGDVDGNVGGNGNTGGTTNTGGANAGGGTGTGGTGPNTVGGGVAPAPPSDGTTPCTDAEFESARPTATTDRVCTPFAVTCAAGTRVANSNRNTDNTTVAMARFTSDRTCTSCPAGSGTYVQP